jgi:DNA-binding transcriptional regulator LsrR (DeoR family)
MTLYAPPYSKEEIRARGMALYETKIRSLVEAGNQDKIVAIDVESGEFELGEDTIVACDRLLDRLPDAVIWRVRVGHLAVNRFGIGRLV